MSQDVAIQDVAMLVPETQECAGDLVAIDSIVRLLRRRADDDCLGVDEDGLFARGRTGLQVTRRAALIAHSLRDRTQYRHGVFLICL